MATDLADPRKLKLKPQQVKTRSNLTVLHKTRCQVLFKVGQKRGLKTGEWLESLRGS